LSCGSTGTTAASDAHPASDPLPGVTGYRTPRSGSKIRRPPGRGGPPQFPPPPSIRSAPHTPGSPSRLRFQALRRFHGLRPDFGGSALPAPALAGETSNDAAGFASCYGPHRRSPIQGFRRWAPAPPVSRPNRQPATGPPGSYPDRTSTGRRRRAYEQQDSAATSQRHLPLCWAHERSRLGQPRPGSRCHHGGRPAR
jgi:hypothetical protein